VFQGIYLIIGQKHTSQGMLRKQLLMDLFKLRYLEVPPCQEIAGRLPCMGDVHVMIGYMHVPATLTCTVVHGKESQEQAEKGPSRMGEQG